MWFSSLFGILRDAFRPQRDMFRRLRKKKDNTPRVRTGKLKKVPFYSHLPTHQIQVYQRYIDRAFEMSPTLEFTGNDTQLHGLLADAAQNYSLSELDFELMRLQYIYADEFLRKKHRSRWVETVINRKDDDFFPDAWTIIAEIFFRSRLGTPVGHGVGSEAHNEMT